MENTYAITKFSEFANDQKRGQHAELLSLMKAYWDSSITLGQLRDRYLAPKRVDPEKPFDANNSRYNYRPADADDIIAIFGALYLQNYRGVKLEKLIEILSLHPFNQGNGLDENQKKFLQAGITKYKQAQPEDIPDLFPEFVRAVEKPETVAVERPKPKNSLAAERRLLFLFAAIVFILAVVVIYLLWATRENNLPRVVMRTINGVEMVWVPAGCFDMGHSDGRADRTINVVHEQCFEQGFWIDRYEVTNEVYGSPPDVTSNDCDFKRVDGEVTTIRMGGDEPERPRNCVNWFEAVEHCASRDARLPTEREWEYAARGPNNFVYPWGNEFNQDLANTLIIGNGPYFERDKARYEGGQSWVGAYNMSGGLFEWTSSIMRDYPYDPNDGREDPTDLTSERVQRGGSWDFPYDSGGNLIAASYYRSSMPPDGRFNDKGFRCVSDLGYDE